MRCVAIVLAMTGGCAASEAPPQGRVDICVRTDAELPPPIEPYVLEDAVVIAEEARLVPLLGNDCDATPRLDVELERPDGKRFRLTVVERDIDEAATGDTAVIAPGTRLHGFVDSTRFRLRLELADEDGFVFAAQRHAPVADVGAVRVAREELIDGPFRDSCGVVETTALRFGEDAAVIESATNGVAAIDGRRVAVSNVISTRYTPDARGCTDVVAGDFAHWVAVRSD